MRLCFNLQLPDSDLRIGGHADMRARSYLGHAGYEYKRFFPLVEALELLTKINEWQLARFAMVGKVVPPLYESGVVYVAEPFNEEEWLDIPTLYKKGYGDCEDLAAARAAEYRFNGVPAVCCIRAKDIVSSHGPITLVHCLVLLPDGTVEDPSKILGMKGEA